MTGWTARARRITIQAAMDGIDLAFSLEDRVAPHLAIGALVRVLEDWCPPFAGFFLYYPSVASSQPRSPLSKPFVCGSRHPAIRGSPS